MSFAGFPRDAVYTPVPNLLLGPLLEGIQDLAELKVTLRGVYLWHLNKGRPKMLSLSDFLGDRSLQRGLMGPGRDPREEIRRGLQKTVARGTFLLFQRSAGNGETQEFYLLNTHSDRRVVAQLSQQGGFTSEPTASYTPVAMEEGPGERPNIFGLYEDNIGTISPLLAEQMKEVEGLYPWSWIKEAFEIAVSGNKRNWRYITGILRRWAAEGKDHGKPGRYPQKDDRQKYFEDYERRWGGVGQRPGGRGGVS